MNNKSTSDMPIWQLSRIIGMGAIGLIAALLLIKLIWVFSFEMSGDKLLKGETRADLMERRAYLLDETTNIKHVREAVPPMVGSQIAGEMVISTCSMTTLALTNLSFS